MTAEIIHVDWHQVALVAGLIVLVGIWTWRLGLGLTQRLWIHALRMIGQLTVIGYVLTWIFSLSQWWMVGGWGLGMLLMAGWEVQSRQQRPLRGWRGPAIGTWAMGISSGVVTIILLAGIVQPDPWWNPRYAIPMLGMLLGNTMTGISLAMERMTTGIANHQAIIEARIACGYTPDVTLLPYRREAIRTALIPTINGMAAAGLVSLPGMMTGQILAGADPTLAVRYQIIIFCGIAVAVTIGAVVAVQLVARRMVDERGRLRFDRIHNV